MRKKSTKMFKFILLVLILSGFGLLNSYGQEYKDGILQGTIRIKIKPTLAANVKISKSASTGIISTGIQQLDKLNQAYAVTDMKRVFRYSPKFEEKHKQYGLNLWYEVTIGSNETSTQAVKSYASLVEIDKSEPILERVIIDGSTKPTYLSKTAKGTTSEYFNDPYLPKQWHYNNIGQSGGTPGSDINAYKAWEITKGSKNVIVSIHDQGVDVDHEDLKDAMWINETELNGVAGVDDDGNGYKDDIYGFNFAQNMGSIDAMPHGTHVAGTIGAVNNNGIGVSGVAGGSGSGDGVRIMSCQIMGGVAWGNTPDSYIYAADMGAVISQNSWGYSYPGAYEQSILDAIDYFIAEAGNYAGSPMKGGVVIFAAGNSAIEEPSYPGYYESCVAVAALNASSHLTVYSNYGTWVDIAAPGGQVEDNIPGSDFKNGVLSTLDNDSYGFMDGTSMACPHISGVAALVVSKFGGSGFTNKDLKNRLLTGTRFIDDITENQNYIGKMGSGSADAFLALATNNNIAPNTITDLQLSGIAQDFANITWKVPADNDDIKPVGFEVLYSTQEISLATLQYAKTINLNSRLAPGETESLEITYLKPLTKYYFSVRSIDRWGNKSEFSNSVSGTTNAGPDAQVDPNVSALDILIDVSVDPNGSQSFNLLNNGEGLLKWDATTHHQYANPSSIKNISYPKVQTTHFSNGKNVLSAPAGEVGRPIAFAIDKPIDESMGYLNAYELWVIGENDTTYTNSSATRFRVDSAAGFNLTNVEAFLVHKESTGPIILEIYEGENIADGRIVYKQEVAYSAEYGFTNITLDERIFFEQGKYFWIVFHVPALNKYPLGAGIERNKDDSKNCYYSSDLGATWMMFEDIYFDNQLVWAVTASSKYANLGDYVTLSPITGTVESNNSTSISATVDATNLVNGNYATKIVVSTNETEEPLLYMPVNLTVQGHKPIINSAKRVDVGGVLNGNEKTFEVKLQNTGLGRFQFESYGYDPDLNSIYFQISNPQFTYVSGLNSYFESGTEQTLKFKFIPNQLGNISSTVQMKDNKGNTYSFQLYGFGIDPPVISLTPTESTVVGKAIGDIITGEFNIQNNGTYPLDYFVPAFADGSNMAELSTNIHRFGYEESTNPAGVNPAPIYDWTEISTTGIDITPSLSVASERFYKVDIGFEFPFFGKKESSLYISRISTLSFDTEDAYWATGASFKQRYLPNRIISVMGAPTNTEIGGHVYCQRFPDKFIVEWDNVPLYNGDLGYGTYQAVLHDNGNINIYIKDITPGQWGDLETVAQSTYIGIEDQNKKDGIRITDYYVQNIDILANGSAIEFVNPGIGLFSTLSNPFGTVQAGESVKLEYTINTADLYVADYTEKLVVLSNDPVNNPSLFTANFGITSGGVPNFIVSHTNIDFGQVFQNDEKKLSFFVADTGKAPTTILSANFQQGHFTIDGTFPIVIKPGKAFNYDVTLNTNALGTFNDVLVISTSEGKTYEIAMTGVVIDAPEMSADITEIIETLASGDKKNISLTVTNNGTRDLDLAPIGNAWISISTPVTKQVSEIPDFSYQLTKSTESNGPKFNWVEIAETGTKAELVWLSMEPLPWSNKIDIPFNFKFYGIDYNYFYIGYNGIISFTEGQELQMFDAQPIPSAVAPNNYIAPIYGFNTPDLYNNPDAGHYYKIEEDRVIIEFFQFQALAMSGPMSFEVILYKNGNIEMQYKLVEENSIDFITNFGIIGIENADGTDGVQISYYNSLGQDQKAYLLAPVNKYEVAAGQSKNFNVNLDATHLFAGDYQTDLKIINNAPLAQGTSIPVSLTVTGAPDVISPLSVEVGDILVIETPDDWSSPFKSYEKEFVIENAGTAKAEILLFDNSKMTSSTVYAYVLGPGMFGGMSYQWTEVAYLPEVDWNTGQPIPLYLQPKSSIKFKVAVSPTMAGEIKDTLIVTTNNGTFEIPINAKAFLPPTISTDMDKVEVYAQTAAFTDSKTVQLANTEGGYELQYSLEIDYKRAVETTGLANYSNLKSSSSAPLLLAKKAENTNKKVKSTKESFNRTLSYESSTAAESGLGYGGSGAFYSMTAFQSPSDGFNLTDVQTWYMPGSWFKSKIKVQVYAGSNDIYKATLIHSQIYEYNITEVNPAGELLTIHLDKNLVFYPNEYFYVVFGYETGADYPQGVVTMPQVTKNRYLYGNGDGTWYDISDEGTDLSSFGWIVRALEANSQSGVWVSLASDASGTVQPGLSTGLSLNFNANYAKAGDNQANLIITSNDPSKPKKTVALMLHLNQGPILVVEKNAYTVNENGVVYFQAVATDVEGDNFTMAIKSGPAFVTNTIASNTMEITCSPTFNDAGEHTVTVEATDAFGNKSEVSVLVTVKNINRAPVVIDPIGGQGFDPADMPLIKISDVIADPDGENLVYSVTSSNESIVNLFLSNDGVIFTAIGAGTTTITFTGTDAAGLSATHTFDISVWATGVDELTAENIKFYPNPTKGEVNLLLPQNLKEGSTIRITNLIGLVLYEQKLEKKTNQLLLDISGFADGIYLIKIENNGFEKTLNVIKN